jgi:hypothetical protein
MSEQQRRLSEAERAEVQKRAEAAPSRAEAWLAANRTETVAKRAMPVGATLVMKREPIMSRADYLELFKQQNPDVRILTQSELTKWIEKQHNAAPPSATPISKRDGATEKKTMGSIFRGSAFDIMKSEDVQEFDINGKRVKADPVATAIASANGKPTDAKRDPRYLADAFLSGDEGRDAYIGGPTVSGDLRSPVKTPYLLHAPGVIQPDLNLNYPDPTESDVVDEPGMYRPSQPAPLRLGNAYVAPDQWHAVDVFKREHSGLFTDLLLGEEK